MASKYALETVFSLIDRVSRPLDKIGVKSSAVSRRIQRDFVAAQRRLDNFGKAISKWGKRAALAATAAATAWVGIGVRNALTLADTMARIGSNANMTGPPLQQLQKNLMNVAGRAGVAVNELASIANTAIGFGVAAEASAEFAGVVAKTARVTGDSTDKIIAGITTVLAAYGKTAEEGNRVAGIMISASRLGRTSVQQMAYGMRYVIPVAAELGVQAEDVFASVTALTSSGLTTRDAMQSLGKALSAVRAPSNNASAIAQKLGLDFSEAALQSKGLAGFMSEIRRKTGGDTHILEALFGNANVARSMSILATTGAEAFNEALAEMSKATDTVAVEFARVTDTPAERWRKAINRIQNTGVRLGTSLLPVAERIIGKFTEMADRLSSVDFSRFTAAVDRAFRGMERLGRMFFGIVNLAWRFRVVLIVIAATLGAYHAALMLAALAVKTSAVWTGIAKTATFAWTLATKGQTAALAKLKGGTLAYNIALKAFAIGAKAAAAAQKIFNFVLKANPIGLVITAIGALVGLIILLARNWERVTDAIRNNIERTLGIISIFTGPFGYVISVIRELHNNWYRVVEAFRDGDILGAIKKIGRVLLSGLLAPIQGLLEILSHIPGLRHLAGTGADKIAGLRNSLLGEGSEISARTGRRTNESAVETVKMEPDLSSYNHAVRAIEMSNIEVPGIDLSELNVPNINLGGGRVRGVVDISGGGAASAIPNFSRGDVPGSFTVNQPAAPAVSVQEAIRTAAYGISGILREIFASIRVIESASVRVNSGKTEREYVEKENPRNIAPVTREERITHSIQEQRLAIEVVAGQGTQARVVRAPRSPNIHLVNSGSNV
ncbi:MAG: phage tail tape measure protein [Treponema sp.]|nr:phage tail tape measure protein [Treponema sp.]